MPSKGRVRFAPAARLDLLAINDYIADHAGPGVADRYLARVERACFALRDFPERGTLHESIGAGVRTMGFERRVTIAFRVVGQDVQILRVLYGGRKLDASLLDED